MLGLEMLDVLIGLVTVYLVFGMACTAIVEAVMLWLNVRSNNLEAALKEFLHGELKDGWSFVDAFYAHPLVQMLSKGPDGRPSYIPPEIVGQVVAALLAANEDVPLAQSVASLPDKDNRIRGLLTVLATETQGDTAAFRKAVEAHFNVTMDRASGWVKRYAHNVTLVVSILLVVGANVDTVSLATSLASNPEARVKMVEIAQQRLNDAQEQERKLMGSEPGAISPDALARAKERSASANTAVKEAAFTMKSAGLRMGWNERPKGVEWLTKTVGLMVSILAVSLGAPFWFDILQKFMQVRSSGVSPRETKSMGK